MNVIGVYRHWPAALAASLGIVASLSMFDHARKTAEDRISAEFSNQAETRARDLQEVLSRYEGTDRGLRRSLPLSRTRQRAVPRLRQERLSRQQRIAIGVRNAVLGAAGRRPGPRRLPRSRRAAPSATTPMRSAKKTADGSLQIRPPQGNRTTTRCAMSSRSAPTPRSVSTCCRSERAAGRRSPWAR